MTKYNKHDILNMARQKAVYKNQFLGGIKMFYEIVRRESWVKVAEAWADLKAAGTATAAIFWAGGNYFVLVEDVPSNPRTYVAESIRDLFASDNYTFFRKEEFKKI